MIKGYVRNGERVVTVEVEKASELKDALIAASESIGGLFNETQKQDNDEEPVLDVLSLFNFSKSIHTADEKLQNAKLQDAREKHIHRNARIEALEDALILVNNTRSSIVDELNRLYEERAGGNYPADAE